MRAVDVTYRDGLRAKVNGDAALPDTVARDADSALGRKSHFILRAERRKVALRERSGHTRAVAW